MDWYHGKLWLEHASGLAPDALHIYAGIFIQVAAALVLRKPLRSPWPWLVVAAIEFANEVNDYRYEVWPDRGIQFAEGFKDMWNTMAMPSAILLVNRYAPSLLVGRRLSDADPGE